jgi:hypothetical protein
VIRRLIGRDHPHRDIVVAAPLDPPRRPLADRVGVDQQRHHHRRIVRRAPPAVLAIALKERGEVHRFDGIEHKPREVILRQPLPQARRQQQLLLAITRDEVLRHPRMVLTPPDGALCNSHRQKQDGAPAFPARALAGSSPVSLSPRTTTRSTGSRLLLRDETSVPPLLDPSAACYPVGRQAALATDLL